MIYFSFPCIRGSLLIESLTLGSCERGQSHIRSPCNNHSVVSFINSLNIGHEILLHDVFDTDRGARLVHPLAIPHSQTVGDVEISPCQQPLLRK